MLSQGINDEKDDFLKKVALTSKGARQPPAVSTACQHGLSLILVTDAQRTLLRFLRPLLPTSHLRALPEAMVGSSCSIWVHDY